MGEVAFDETGRLVRTVGTLQDISAHKQADETRPIHATHDALTGLLNRDEFERRVQRVLDTARTLSGEHALCYLDLDRFRVVNDACGQIAGDELLRQLGELLSGVVRKRDTLARLGGDEFGILMEHCTLEQAHRVAYKVRSEVAKFHFAWDEQVFHIAVSTGLVPITETSESPAALLSAAANDCNEAKREARSGALVAAVLDAYHRGDYETALREWGLLAEQGDADAQSNLGRMYDTGKGVPKDYAVAASWYRKAAEQGHAAAQYNLGVMHGKGHGVAQDFTAAALWYHKAAGQGVASAQHNLGVMYKMGEGVPQDDAAAALWYRMAAEQGHAAAQANLGFMYDTGQGVRQDYAKAVEWCQKAAEQGHVVAQTFLGFMYDNGQGVQQDYVKAVMWYRKAAEQGHPPAQASLGLMFGNGHGVPKDFSQA